MYEEYWQLESKPFEPTTNDSFFYHADRQQAALHKLRYAIESRRESALLVGPAGIGKTLLVSVLNEQLDETVDRFVRVVFPLMSSRDLLVYLAEQLGIPPADPPKHTVEESLCRLQYAFDESSRRGLHTVILVEEAHLLEDSGLLETLRLLLNLQSADQRAFTLLLSGQPALLSAIQRNRPLEQRIDIKILLQTFSSDETAAYIQHRMLAAGATRTIFAEDALQLAHQLTGGIPKRINRLCDLALVVGFAANQHTIGETELQSVNDELVTISAAA